jgi:hypothetical protein
MSRSMFRSRSISISMSMANCPMVGLSISILALGAPRRHCTFSSKISEYSLI